MTSDRFDPEPMRRREPGKVRLFDLLFVNADRRANSFGGGIFEVGNLNSSGDTFSSNSANSYGGGIDTNGGTVTATNDTFFGNSSAYYSGGAISNYGGQLLTINVTIAGNVAFTSGGGVYSAYNSWTALNTIVTGNTFVAPNQARNGTPSDVMNDQGTFTARNTLIGDATTAGGIVNGVNGNIVGKATASIFITDNNFKPVLTNNGGPNLTVPLIGGSPAIGHGGSLATLTAPTTTSTTTFVVDDATFIVVGDLLRIDSENMLVTDVSGTSVTVLSGLGGPAANHAANAAVPLAFDQAGKSRTVRTMGALVTPVTSFNHAPMGVAKTVTILEGQFYIFNKADFGFSDPRDTPANTMVAVKITSLPRVGNLTDNGASVTAGALIPVADLTGSKLKFTPATGAAGVGYANFLFKVQDNGGTANGGVDTDTTARKMTITVT